jgi:hypothetical protein
MKEDASTLATLWKREKPASYLHGKFKVSVASSLTRKVMFVGSPNFGRQ